MDQQTFNRVATSLDRIAKILGGLLLKDIEGQEQIKKVARLKGCGFSNSEIAEMLHTTPNTINVAVHSLRSGKGKRKKGAKK